jgi:ABC-type bacteriocin/lantibiotic exporter with double-glycine peptidase domain
MVLASLGTTKTEMELRSLTDCTFLGTEALNMVEAARKLGFFRTKKHSLSFEELREVLADGICPIVYLRVRLSSGQLPQRHAAIVEAMDDDGIHLVDPWRGRITYSFDTFKKEWSVFHGLTIIVE